MMTQQMAVLRDYEEDPTASPDQQLKDLLELFGRDPTYEIPHKSAADDRVDIQALAEEVPADFKEGMTNPAKAELNHYYYAIDPKLRRKGVFLPADSLVSLLLERLEFFEQLSRNVARVCTGKECPHFRVCGWKHVVADVTEEDGVKCAVERDLVKDYTKQFVDPDHGKPAVDPGRPEMAFMFKQLMQLVVKQVRYAMYMQVEDLKVQEYDVVRNSDGSESPIALNDVEHPLMQGWQRTTSEINKVLQKMGKTPEFMQRQGLLVEEAEKADAEERALELTKDTFEHMLEQTPEDEEGHKMLSEAISSIEEMQAEQAETDPDQLTQ